MTCPRPDITLRRSVFGLILAAVGWAAEPSPEQIEFFESKIRPILAESCYKCHSVEAGKSKADLLLDSRDALRKGGATGPAIVPGDPEKSLLIEAIRHTNDDLQMPPEEEGGKLSAEKIALLEEWVRMGAPDPRTGGKPHPLDMAAARKHWAFQPVAKPAVPRVRQQKLVATPVDAFVLAQLEARKLAPSPAADARTLLRRVTFDLTGLPPTPGEMDAFLADRSPEAYAKAVERLLASPRYGERWGRFWLDVARYADTKGYLAGNVERRYTFSHTYRDYVIRAFNDDKPYDAFIIEQLAADHLPLGEDKSALAALGFITLGRRFLNNQNDIIDDRIDVVTRGLMGLTVTCARCHDHKFDPIPAKDYYSLHGVFASSEEPAEKPLLGPLVDSPAYQEFLRKTAAIEARIKDTERTEVEKFLSGIRAKTGDYLLAARDAQTLPEGEKLELFAGARKLNPDVLKRYQSWLAERRQRFDAVLAPWFALAGLPKTDFADTAASVLATLLTPGGSSATGPSEGSGAGGSLNPIVAEALARPVKRLESLGDVAAIYNEIFSTVDKAWQKQADEARKANADAPTALDDPNQESIRRLIHAEDAPAYVAYDSAVEMIRRQISTRTAPLKREIEALNWTEPGAPLRAMALVDRKSPSNSRVFLRGNPANRGPEVPRQFLEILAGGERVPFTNGSGRFDLARAIASPENPLTARVMVNRIWGWHFGQPLVRTPSDFGVRTEAPVHRDLLDWLAASFVESGWSVKALHRVIVLSRAYRQSSDERPAASAIDSDNHLVHRFNRRRLEFEALRDSLLAVSGTLDERAGGLPDDLTQEPFTVRRTVYGFIDRQNLPGMFRTFDFPNPDVSSAQRFATTVPQQALFMMNSPFSQEQARQLMRRSEINNVAGDTQKIAALYRVIFQREPDAEERKMAEAFLGRPLPVEQPQPVVSAGWQYGHGEFDATAKRVREFQRMTIRKDGKVVPAEKLPDPKFGQLSVTATGGHPGRTAEFASIRRWTAPAPGSIRIEANLGHASANGDGVHGRIVASNRGQLGEWSVHNTKAATPIEKVSVDAGEFVDFVVEPLANATADAYTWSPVITFTPHPEVVDTTVRTWNAKTDFDKPVRAAAPLTRWEEFAQVLLLSNEFAFVD